jgi:hypothetical protein
MKTLILTLVLALTSTTMTHSAHAAGALPQTDLDKVYGTGVNNNPTSARGFSLNAGVYVIGGEKSKIRGTNYLVIDRYANDPSRFFALMVSQENESARGQFFMGKKIKNGAAIMLSPVFIDNNGNLAIESELNNRAAIIEISLRSDAGKVRYPYLLQGHNGALNGQLLGMRAASGETVRFTTRPSQTIFSGADSNDNLVVSGNSVTMHNASSMQQSFEMVGVNGDGGKIAAMLSGEFDTMGEYMTSDSSISRLAFFMKTASGKEMFVVASPSYRVGEYGLKFYSPRSRSLVDFFFPGLE